MSIFNTSSVTTLLEKAYLSGKRYPSKSVRVYVNPKVEMNVVSVVSERNSVLSKLLLPPSKSSFSSIPAISSFLNPSGMVTHISNPLDC